MKRIFLVTYLALCLMAINAFAANVGAWKGAEPPVDWSNVEITGGTAAFSTVNQPRYVSVQVDAVATSATAGTKKIGFNIPADLAGYYLAGCEPRVYTAGVTGTLGITLTKRTTAGAEAAAYTAAVTTGVVAASSGAGTLANRTVTTGDMVFIDVTSIHSGTASKGLWVSIEFNK